MDNPYAPSQANLEPASSSATDPKSVPAGHGWTWVTDAARLVMARPWLWMGVLAVFILVNLGLGMVPLLGSVATSVLSPVFGAGLFLAARAADSGEGLSVSHLFAGFNHNPGRLMLVGVIYFAGVMVVAILAVGVLAATGVFSGFLLEAKHGHLDPMMFALIALVVLVALALIIPLQMAYWFAPALVAIDGMEALPAMRASFTACMRNVMPFLVYGIATLLLVIVCAIPLGLGLLIGVPILTVSMYTAFKDIFGSCTQSDHITAS